MNCPFCKSILYYNECSNHKFMIRFYEHKNLKICFDICSQYTLSIDKDHISVFDFMRFKYVIKINNISPNFQITPDNAESVLLKLLSLKAFS